MAAVHGRFDGEATGERVLRVATELFAERGYDATGVQDISEATGLGRGALYYHIKSKQELLLRIAVGLLTTALESAREIVSRDSEVSVRLAALSEHLVNDLVAQRAAWVTSMRDWEALDGEARAYVLSLRDQYERTWQQLFDEGVETGELRPVDPVLRKAIIGMFTSSHNWIEPGGPLSPAEIGRTYVDFMLHGLAAPSPTRERR
jgi:AcrR family transcriptional regulator